MAKGEQGYWIIDSEKVPFEDTFKSGNHVAGILVAPFSGSRGDIETAAQWKDGRWVLEIKRALVTTGENAAVQDVQFNDLSKSYPFGVAVFDNAQINHVYHERSHALKFK